MKKMVVVCGFVAALVGCASSGVQVSQEAAMQFKEGVSTEADVVAKLGKPSMMTIAGGKKMLIYSGAQYQTKPETFIPFVGAFVGGADMQFSSVTYQIGSGGVVEKIGYTSSSTNSRMGTTSAPMPSGEPRAVK